MNKYATIYFEKLAAGNVTLAPWLEHITKDGIGLGATGGGVLGAVGGAGAGLVTDPGYDEAGQKKSKLKHVLKNIAIGGVGGAVTGGAGGLLGGTNALAQLGLIKSAGTPTTPLGTPLKDPVPPKVIPSGKIIMPSKKQMIDEGKMDLLNYESDKKK